MTSKRRWFDPLIALILIFILPGCWSGVLAGPLENETAPFSSTTDEESEKHKLENEASLARSRVRPPEPPSGAVATAPKQKPVTHQASTLLASVAPKSHPSRFSVRRLQ